MPHECDRSNSELADTRCLNLVMCFTQFNCYEFTSDVVPFAEKKLAGDLDLGV